LDKLKSGKYHVPDEAGTNARLDMHGDADNGIGVSRIEIEKNADGERKFEPLHRSRVFQTDSRILQSNQELQLLKQHADSIKEQLDVIKKRIDDIEKQTGSHDDVRKGAV
jgi:hypothetical protein